MKILEYIHNKIYNVQIKALWVMDSSYILVYKNKIGTLLLTSGQAIMLPSLNEEKKSTLF